jgi:hypothetical protein
MVRNVAKKGSVAIGSPRHAGNEQTVETEIKKNVHENVV